MDDDLAKRQQHEREMQRERHQHKMDMLRIQRGDSPADNPPPPGKGERIREHENLQAQTAGAISGVGECPPTLAEQSAKNCHYHSEQAQKHGEAAQFLFAHPEFDQFIRLVRSGAIQF